jgi:3-isopropylmalate/(R)-2-methylmalate dehydratase small subunit
VWALRAWGLRCVIAPSFGDIFFTNACINGLLPVQMPVDVVRRLSVLAEDPAHRAFNVSLESESVTAPDGSVHAFRINRHYRELMLAGLDEIGFTLAQLSKIEAFEAYHRRQRPWIWPEGLKTLGR